MVRLLRSRRIADEHASRALLEKPRFDEVPKQYPTHLRVEAGPRRGVSRRELEAACLREQVLNTCEASLKRGVWCGCDMCAAPPSRYGLRGTRPLASVGTWLMYAEIRSPIVHPASCRGFDEG